jgi:DnaJ-class molecular chaperone
MLIGKARKVESEIHREQMKQKEWEDGFREAREQSWREWEQFVRSRRNGLTYSQSLEVLGLSPPVTRLEIRTAYLNLAKVHHPDAGGDADAFRRIDDAYRAALASS